MERKIVIENFDGPGEHLYEDGLGWQANERRITKSDVSKIIFRKLIVETGLNMSFFNVDDGIYYGIHTEDLPIKVKKLPMDKTAEYPAWQCKVNTHADGEIIAVFDDASDIWDKLRIEGKTLEEVIQRSVIMDLN